MTDSASSPQPPNETQLTLRFDKFASFVQQFSGNLALGGAFVETPKVRPVGTEVQLTCELPDGFHLLRGLGDVVWTRPRDNGPGRPAGMGIRFNALDQNSRELVLKIVEENLKDGGEPFEIERVPADATDTALPATDDVSLDDLSEDPTMVGSLVAEPIAPPAPAAAGPSFAAPWGEKLPEIPVDILDTESDPEIEEAVRSIRPDPSLMVPPAEAAESAEDAADEAAQEPTEAPAEPAIEPAALAAPEAPVAPEAPQAPAAPDAPVAPVAPSAPAAPAGAVAADAPVPEAPVLDPSAFVDVEPAPPLAEDETFIPSIPKVEAAGMEAEVPVADAPSEEVTAPIALESVLEAPSFETPSAEAPAFDEPALDEPAFDEVAFEVPTAAAPAFDPVAEGAPTFDSEAAVAEDDLDPPTVVFAAEDDPVAEVAAPAEPEPPASEPMVHMLPTEPEAPAFDLTDDEPAAVVFEPPADDLDTYSIEDEADGVDFGGSFSSAPEIDEVDFGEPAPADPVAEASGGDVSGGLVAPSEAITAAMPFEAVEEPATSAGLAETPSPESSFEPSFEPAFEPTVEPAFEPSTADPLAGDFDPLAVPDPSAAADGDAASVMDAGLPAEMPEIVTPAAEAMSSLGEPPEADDFATPMASAPTEAPLGDVAGGFDAPAYEPVADPMAGLDSAADSVGAVHADDFVDAWDGEPGMAAHHADLAAPTAGGRKLPVVPLLAALLVLAVAGAGYVFRAELGELVGLGGSPEPVAQQARGERPSGPPPAAQPAAGLEQPADPDAGDLEVVPVDGEAPPPTDPALLDPGVEDGVGEATPVDEPAVDPRPAPSDPEPADPTPVELIEVPAPAPPPAAPPREARPSSPPRTPSGGPATILSIDWQDRGDGTRVVLRFDRPVDNGLFEFDPLVWAADREMLKLFGVANYPRNEIAVATRELARIRLGLHGTDELRLVFDLGASGESNARVSPNGDTLSLHFPRR